MSKQPTQAAKAASAIRAALRSTKLNAKITCRNFSMGNSVDVRLNDERPEIVDLVRKLVNKFQYGHFDGMTDCYEYSNTNKDLPQVKFAHVSNDMSDAKRQEVYAFVRGYHKGGDELPDNYGDAHSITLFGEWVSQLIHREFCQIDSAYWRAKRETKAA